jgi:hypothetical protein
MPTMSINDGSILMPSLMMKSTHRKKSNAPVVTVKRPIDINNNIQSVSKIISHPEEEYVIDGDEMPGYSANLVDYETGSPSYMSAQISPDRRKQRKKVKVYRKIKKCKCKKK